MVSGRAPKRYGGKSFDRFSRTRLVMQKYFTMLYSIAYTLLLVLIILLEFSRVVVNNGIKVVSAIASA